MGWKDDPVVSGGGWRSDPVVGGAKPYTVWGEGGEVSQALGRLKADAKLAYSPAPDAAYRPVPANGRPIDKALEVASGAGRPGARNPGGERAAAADRLGGDVMNVLMSPVVGTVRKYVNKPLAGAIAPLVGQTPEQTEQDIGVFEQAGLMALGPRTWPGEVRAGVRAAPRVAEAQNAFTPKPQGPVAKAVAPFQARVSPAAAERQAGRVLAERASDPAAARTNLEAGPQAIVPGSVPTTFQQTGDLGLGALEREVATRNPAPFAERRAEQNAARVDSLKGVQSGADSTDVAKLFRQHLDDLEAETQSRVDAAQTQGAMNVARVDAETGQALDAATTAAQGRAEAIGGTGTPEAYGEALRSSVLDAKSAAHDQASALYKRVDPNGDLTGNATHTRSAADDILRNEPATARPPEGEEAAIFDVARNLGDLVPARDLIALRQRLRAAMSDEAKTASMASPAYARMAKLKSAMDDNLDRTIADKIAADDAAVASGTMSPDDTFAARLQAEAEQWRAGRQQAGRAAVGSGTADDPASRALAVPGPDRAEGAPAGGPGDVAGNPGLPPVEGPVAAPAAAAPDPLTPTFDAAARQRQAEADAGWREYRSTFGIRSIEDITRTNGQSGDFRLRSGEVPGKFFRAGPGSFSDIQGLLKAQPDALPVLEDYAALSLKRAAMSPEGVIDPGKFSTWRARYADALRALPEATRNRFASAAEAGKAVADAAVARTAALKAMQAKAAEDVAAAVAAQKLAMRSAQSGPEGRLGNLSEPEDIVRTIGSILNSRTAVADMRGLATAARKDANAFAGLRQAVADHILTKYIGNTEVGASGVAGIKADAFQTFVRQSRAALLTVFKPDEVRAMEAIAADIQRAKRSETAVKNPGGSNTAQDTFGATKGQPSRAARSFIDMLVAAKGFILGGPIGAVVGAMGADLIQGFRAAGIERVDQLVTRAMLDPALARELLRKVEIGAKPTSQERALGGRGRAVLRALNAPGLRTAVAVAPAASGAQPRPTETPNALLPPGN